MNVGGWGVFCAEGTSSEKAHSFVCLRNNEVASVLEHSEQRNR